MAWVPALAHSFHRRGSPVLCQCPAQFPSSKVDRRSPMRRHRNARTSKQRAIMRPLRRRFRPKAGAFCIASLAGLGGSLTYPPANPSVGVTLTGSTTNYNGKLPSLHSGKPILYLQLAIAGATSFGQNAPAGGGFTGQPVKAGHTYTAYAQAVISGFPINFTAVLHRCHQRYVRRRNRRLRNADQGANAPKRGFRRHRNLFG